MISSFKKNGKNELIMPLTCGAARKILSKIMSVNFPIDLAFIAVIIVIHVIEGL